MDLRKVKKLIELAEEAGLAELEVTSGDESVRIALARPMAGPSDVVADVPPRVVAGAPASVGKATGVPAPMAGTFYQAPNPGAEPFVRVGDAVQTGEVLCIIESMKMHFLSRVDEWIGMDVPDEGTEDYDTWHQSWPTLTPSKTLTK